MVSSFGVSSAIPLIAVESIGWLGSWLGSCAISGEAISPIADPSPESIPAPGSEI